MAEEKKEEKKRSFAKASEGKEEKKEEGENKVKKVEETKPEEKKPSFTEASPSAKASGDKPSFAKATEDKEEKKQEKKQEKQEKEAKTKAKLSAKLEEMAKKIEGLTALELSELASYLEDKFGVLAQPTIVSAAAPQAGAAPTAAGEPLEEKTIYTVVLTEAGGNKLAVIKAVREIDQSLGLMDAKKLVESLPKEILKEVKKEEAEEAKKKIEAAGGKVELK